MWGVVVGAGLQSFLHEVKHSAPRATVRISVKDSAKVGVICLGACECVHGVTVGIELPVSLFGVHQGFKFGNLLWRHQWVVPVRKREVSEAEFLLGHGRLLPWGRATVTP